MAAMTNVSCKRGSAPRLWMCSMPHSTRYKSPHRVATILTKASGRPNVLMMSCMVKSKESACGGYHYCGHQYCKNECRPVVTRSVRVHFLLSNQSIMIVLIMCRWYLKVRTTIDTQIPDHMHRSHCSMIC